MNRDFFEETEPGVPPRQSDSHSQPTRRSTETPSSTFRQKCVIDETLSNKGLENCLSQTGQKMASDTDRVGIEPLTEKTLDGATTQQQLTPPADLDNRRAIDQDIGYELSSLRSLETSREQRTNAERTDSEPSRELPAASEIEHHQSKQKRGVEHVTPANTENELPPSPKKPRFAHSPDQRKAITKKAKSRKL